jgi:predicted metal-dependent phosphoesterase TrpH
MIPELVQAGLAGLETFYPEHSAGQVEAYRRLCREHDLVATGGSDFHGPHTGRANTLGSPPVPLEVWRALKTCAERLATA